MDGGEGCLEYWFLLPPNPVPFHGSASPADVSAPAPAAPSDPELHRASTLCLQLRAWLQSAFVNYVWEAEPPSLHVLPARSHTISNRTRPPVATHADEDDDGTAAMSSSRMCLYGRLVYGDNHETEWLVVAALLSLTSASHDLVLHVRDDDGDFMCIEGADDLPSWATSPARVRGRVYACRGRVCLIPPHACAVIPDIAVGADYVREHVDECVHAPLEATVLARLAAYPGRAYRHLHTCRIVVPELAARVFTTAPHLLSRAVEAFYTRDTSETTRAAHMHVFGPMGADTSTPTGGSMIAMSVTLTRHQYAKLMMQSFHAPKSYAAVMPSSGSQSFKAFDLGLKLATGLEIIAYQSRTASAKIGDWLAAGRRVAAPASSRAVFEAQFASYVASLRAHGYFADAMDAAAVEAKTARARAHFTCMQANGPAPNDGVMYNDAATRTHVRTSESVANLVTSGALCAILPWPPVSILDESDDWMNEQAMNDALDKAMREAAAVNERAANAETEADDSGDAHHLKSLFSNVSDFMHRVSSHEGVEPASAATDVEGGFDEEDEGDHEDADIDEDNDGAPSQAVRAAQQSPLLTPELVAELLIAMAPAGSSTPFSASLQDALQRADILLRLPSAVPQHATSESRENEDDDEDIMATLDAELATHEALRDFSSVDASTGVTASGADLFVNLAMNMPTSVSAQAGAAGPASNMLEAMDVAVPDAWRMSEQTDGMGAADTAAAVEASMDEDLTPAMLHAASVADARAAAIAQLQQLD